MEFEEKPEISLVATQEKDNPDSETHDCKALGSECLPSLNNTVEVMDRSKTRQTANAKIQVRTSGGLD